MFKNATTKLTFWYLTIIFFINIGFSIIVYAIGSNQINRGIHLQTDRIAQQYPVFSKNNLLKPTRDIADSKHELLLKLFMYNVAVLGLSGIASYFLAKRTLEPIEESHLQQKRFTSDVSHELRTPLTAIRMEGEVALLNKQIGVKELKQTIKSNLEEVEKLEKIINNLLKLSKLEVEDIKSSFVSLDTKDLVDEAINKLDVVARNKKITIENNVKKNIIFGDKDSIVQLISIILENAVKYSDKNKKISIITQKNKEITAIVISDQGIGIAKEDLDNIFSRFYKADQSRNKDTIKEGYGLGLSIAKMIADIHDANIIVTSAPKKGTTVEIVFPKNDL